MKNIITAIITVLLILLSESCINSSKKSYSDGDGVRIVSLAPSITRELEELGMTENIVGATSYCDITKEKKDLIIGDAINVNIEKVLLQKPDMVLTTPLTRQSTIDVLKESGFEVHVIGKIFSFNGLCDQFLQLGKLTGSETKAKYIIDKTKLLIDSLKKTIPENRKGKKVFIQIGADPLFAIIPNTFMDDYIKFAGCRNVTEGFTAGTISRETILNRDPDIIFIATMGMIAKQEKKYWESLSELKAAKNGNIFIIDADVACVPTVENFGKAFEEIVNMITGR